jgi:hypothetical protein
MSISLTFGDRAENHNGMQIIGENAQRGFSSEDLKNLSEKYAKSELINLNDYLPEELKTDSASVLVIRNFLTKKEVALLAKEQFSLKVDTKAKMYGRVVNKNARHNLCFADFSQEANYEEGKGTVINFHDVPELNSLREKLNLIAGINLMCELNLYYDMKKCGIGFHGDTERKIVMCVRLGESNPLHFQWYQQRKRIGERVKLKINEGDMYIMNEKATGNDWKKYSKITLRHAAGCEKFLK